MVGLFKEPYLALLILFCPFYFIDLCFLFSSTFWALFCFTQPSATQKKSGPKHQVLHFGLIIPYCLVSISKHSGKCLQTLSLYSETELVQIVGSTITKSGSPHYLFFDIVSSYVLFVHLFLKIFSVALG